jgi:hypothetical protein
MRVVVLFLEVCLLMCTVVVRLGVSPKIVLVQKHSGLN